MVLTVRYVKNHKHLGLTLPDHAINGHASFNVKVLIDTDVEIKIVYPNGQGFVPFPTFLVPVAMPAEVPDPLTFFNGGAQLQSWHR